MYKVTNICNSNLIINNKNIRFGESMKIDEDTYEKIGHLAEKGILKIEPILTKQTIYQNIASIDLDVDKFKHLTKNDFIEIFYKFHTNTELSEFELEVLIWFYKNISPISLLDTNVKKELDFASNNEELIEILINAIYPHLIDEYIGS